MDDLTILIKTTAIGFGALLSTIITLMFGLSVPAFIAGFIGAFIGEMLLHTPSSFKKSTITIIATSVATGYVGSLFVKYAHNYPPTGILAVVGFALAYHRDFILNGFKDILKAAFDKIKLLINSPKNPPE